MDLNRLYLSQNKVFKHADRIHEWLEKEITKPIMIEIDTTNKCNHNCAFCAGNRTKNIAELDLSFLKKIINQISPFCKGLVFTGGGEPLVNKDTIKAIEYAKSKKIDVALITNGNLITDKNAKIILKNCTWIRISVDGVSSKEYSKNRRISKDSFNLLLKNIQLLVKYKKQLKSKCTIGVGYLINKKNKKNILKFTEMFKKIKVDYVQFRPYHYHEVNIDKEINSSKKLETKNFKVMSTNHRFKKVEGNFKKCFRDEFTTVIAADGKMYPCCFTRGIKDFEIGDLNKKSFNQIWTSKKRKKINNNKLLNPKCPIMVKYDTLNKILWDIYNIKKDNIHLNFV